MLQIKRARPKRVESIEEILLEDEENGRTITVKPSNIWWPYKRPGKFGFKQSETADVVVVNSEELRSFAHGLLELIEQGR